MDFVIICLVNFGFGLGCKVFHRLLLSILCYREHKRPPPIAREFFDGTVSIRFSHFYHLKTIVKERNIYASKLFDKVQSDYGRT